MKIEAAVVWEAGAELSIEEFDLDDPRDDEILVRVEAVGVCHTDDNARLGRLPVVFPIILGHEGAGVVERVGRGVTRVRPGDRGAVHPRLLRPVRAVRARPYAVLRPGRRGHVHRHQAGRLAPCAPARQAGARLLLRPVLVRHPRPGHRAEHRRCSGRRPAALPGRVDLRRADRRGRDAERDAGPSRQPGRDLGHRRRRAGRGDGRRRVGRGRDRRRRPVAHRLTLAAELGATRTIDTTGRGAGRRGRRRSSPRPGPGSTSRWTQPATPP